MSKEKKTEKTENTNQETITQAPSQEGKVGTMLHDVRTKKKIDLETVAKDLYIKAAYLTAIENSDYENIPADPYGVGFVRSYANYLGLNSTRIAQLFKEETDSDKNKNVDYLVLEPQNETTAPNPKYLIISLIMIAAGYILWSNLSTPSEQTETPAASPVAQEYPLQIDTFAQTETAKNVSDAEAETDSQITVTDAVFVDETATPAPTTENNKEETSQPVVETPKEDVVILKVKKETWIEVKDKEKLWLSKVLYAGDEYKVPAGKGKILSFGNTDGVDVVINGKVTTIISPNKKTNINLDKFLDANH